MDLLATPSPGFAAFTATDPLNADALARTVTTRLGGEVTRLDAQTALATWGVAGPTPGASWQLVLGSLARTGDGPLTDDDVRLLLRQGSEAELLADILPPFAAVGWDAEARSVSAITDWLGFRHLYVAR